METDRESLGRMVGGNGKRTGEEGTGGEGTGGEGTGEEGTGEEGEAVFDTHPVLAHLVELSPTG